MKDQDLQSAANELLRNLDREIFKGQLDVEKLPTAVGIVEDFARRIAAASPQVTPSPTASQFTRANRYALRCPHCNKDRANSADAGGNELCFHCGSCGFVECEWSSPAHELSEVTSGQASQVTPSPDYEGLKRKFGITDSAPGYWRMRKRYLAFITKPEVHSEQSFIDAQLGKSAPQHTRPDCSHTVGYSDCERCILESLLRAWARTRDAEREVKSGQAEAPTPERPKCDYTGAPSLDSAQLCRCGTCQLYAKILFNWLTEKEAQRG